MCHQLLDLYDMLQADTDGGIGASGVHSTVTTTLYHASGRRER